MYMKQKADFLKSINNVSHKCRARSPCNNFSVHPFYSYLPLYPQPQGSEVYVLDAIILQSI